MKCKLRVGTLKHPLIVLTLLCVALFVQQSCSTDKVEAPSLTGPSGHRLFITMTATPDHLVIKNAGKRRATSLITAQLKDQNGQGVSGENIKVRITNTNGSEVSIGTLDRLSGATDSGGFFRVTYTAPNISEQPIPVRIYIIAIMTNPAYTFEVTGRHSLDLEAARPPLDCLFGAPDAPVAAFTVTPSPGTINEPVCFDNSPTADDGLIVDTQWVFGDGGIGSGDNVCHTYNSEGLFFVNMTVQDEDRNCSTTSQLVTIGTGTAAGCSILVSPQNPPLGTAVNLTAVITDDGSVRRFSWSFGDGTSTTTSSITTSHLYTVEGSYTVLLTITDDQGNVSNCQTVVTIGSMAPSCDFTVSPPSPQIGQSVSFDASGSTDPDGTIVSYDWGFGDGTPGVSGQVVHHTYTTAGSFVATLTLTDDQGNVTVCNQTVVITSDAPDCDFTFSPQNPNVGESVGFNASASTDPDGTIDNYSWDFGDGNTSAVNANPTVNHTYTSAGTYVVTLTLTDNDGNTSTCTQNITVGSGAPTCTFSANPSGTVSPGTLITFDASASVDPDGGVLTYAWSSPNAVPTNGAGNPYMATYNNPGSFTITLTVTDDEGQSSVCQQTVTVGNLQPICNIQLANLDQGTGIAMFDGSASSDPDGGAIQTFLWTFGDGNSINTGATDNVNHTYVNTGSYTATLQVTDNEGSSTSCNVQVNYNGLAPICDDPSNGVSGVNGITAVADPGTAGVASTFSSDAIDQDEGNTSIVSYQWDFTGDGITDASGQSVQFTYGAAGAQTVTVRVTDDEGVQTTCSRAFTVNP